MRQADFRCHRKGSEQGHGKRKPWEERACRPGPHPVSRRWRHGRRSCLRLEAVPCPGHVAQVPPLRPPECSPGFLPSSPRQHADVRLEHQRAPRLCAGRVPLRAHPAAGAGHWQAGPVYRSARGPGPAHDLRGLIRALRALQPAQHRQDRRRSESLVQQAAVWPAGGAPAYQSGQDLHQLLRHECGQCGLERLHLRLRALLPESTCTTPSRVPSPSILYPSSPKEPPPSSRQINCLETTAVLVSLPCGGIGARWGYWLGSCAGLGGAAVSGSGPGCPPPNLLFRTHISSRNPSRGGVSRLREIGILPGHRPRNQTKRKFEPLS